MTEPTIISNLQPERVARLKELIDEVLRVNLQFNLTAIREPDAAWERHILDSLQALPTGLLEDSQRLIDVGTGAGFPGLALAIARPELKITLLESIQKKCRFLDEAGQKFGLSTKVLCERAEVAGHDAAHRQKYDIATARAVGSLAEVAELCLPLVRVGGSTLLWRGEQAHEELKAAQSALHLLGGAVSDVLEYSLPTHPGRFHLVVIRKSKATPRRFPRRVGLPKKKPLVRTQL